MPEDSVLIHRSDGVLVTRGELWDRICTLQAERDELAEDLERLRGYRDELIAEVKRLRGPA